MNNSSSTCTTKYSIQVLKLPQIIETRVINDNHEEKEETERRT